MDAAGAVTSRHDYLPFGEELGAGTGAPGSRTGMRTTAQGYSAADNVRQRYADTRLDDATGLDHTLWRKLETRSGRWTTPDPYGSSMKMRDPQSFNRYAHVNNDPLNFVDPSGLFAIPINIGNFEVSVTVSFDGPINGLMWGHLMMTLFGNSGDPTTPVDPGTEIDPQDPLKPYSVNNIIDKIKEERRQKDQRQKVWDELGDCVHNNPIAKEALESAYRVD